MAGYELAEEEFVGSFRAPVGNGLLIIQDSNSVDTHASWTGETDIDVTPDSIYLSVQHPVDGPTAVDVFEGPPPTEANEGVVSFDGTIVSSRGTFIVHDPADEIRLVLRTDHQGEVRLRITSDVEWHPTAVRINFWY